jgi:hypothetical protein
MAYSLLSTATGSTRIADRPREGRGSPERVEVERGDPSALDRKGPRLKARGPSPNPNLKREGASDRMPG